MTISRRRVLQGLVATATTASVQPAISSVATAAFRPVQTQFIAALADPLANSGTGAENWGLWRKDPGPRGVRLSDFSQLVANSNVAPAEWTFDKSDWWLEEHGLIMEQPEIGLAAGTYLVTGDRIVQTTLTVFEKDSSGTMRWELGDKAALYDVTHLRCRSARYRPTNSATACTPANVSEAHFPVEPGAAMPPVSGCEKQDYAVLFVVAVQE